MLARTIGILLAACVIGYGMRHAAEALERRPGPAGFARGFLQGALMPAALPNLVVGHDITIYAERNNGVPYKLGYTCGVNTCGAVFFGLFFLRLSRWRRRLNGNSSE